ncbi:TPA: response regulator [Candidatus Avigastranaerophilus faecigallinarum]|nr:response regulator [Candidatus Avigastranaerophilus faecigallinarum]
MDKRILIVDDTKAWRMFHIDLIKQLYGDTFEITVASSAAEALNMIKHNTRNPFYIILTDLQMESDYEPKLAGEWLVEQIKQIREYSSSKIIIVSAMYNIEYIAKKLEVECISKNILIGNKLLMKFMFEKLMPFLKNLN